MALLCAGSKTFCMRNITKMFMEVKPKGHLIKTHKQMKVNAQTDDKRVSRAASRREGGVITDERDCPSLSLF